MWTKEQQSVIDSRNKNLLVSAAAGSGKTAVLVERIIRMVLDNDNPIDIDKLLIVTFTNAAASEMRERIGNAIEKEVIKNPDNVHLQRQLALIHKAQITTIHSFCLDVIKGHYNDIDLDPAFKIADENELVLLKSELLQELLEEKYEESNEDFIDFVESYTTGKTDTQIEELILKLYNFAGSYPDPEEWLTSCIQFYGIGEKDMNQLPQIKFILGYIKTITSDVLQELRMALDMSQQEECAYTEALLSDVEYLESIIQIEDFQQLSQALNNIEFLALSRKKDNVDKQVKELLKSIRNNAKASIQKICKDLLFQTADEMIEDIHKLIPTIKVMIELTIEFMSKFAEAKREKNLLDFGDLEHLALKILVKKDDKGVLVPSPVAEELRDFYAEIIIDEYQDSNLIQDTILSSVSKVLIGAPNIFMVGDVKQSIYKFRLARPELFIEKYNQYSRIESSYQCIELHKNFRSREEVLNVTNYIFNQVMREELGSIQYNEGVALNVGAKFPEENTTNRDVDIIIVEKSAPKDDGPEDEGTSVDDSEEELTSKELEARAIANKINELVNSEQPFLVFDSKQGVYRNIRYNDIVILLRSVSGWSETFIEVLTEEGIPAYADTAAGYFSTVEIRTILSLLMLIDNPRQDIPLGAVLRSPVVDLSGEELVNIRLVDRSVSFYDALEKYYAMHKKIEKSKETEIQKNIKDHVTIEQDITESEENINNIVSVENDTYYKVKHFFEQLNDFREKANYMSIHELIYYVLDETGYYDYASAMPAGAQRRANIDMLLSRAISFENSGFKGLFKFIKYIEKIKKYEIDFGEASIISEKDNTVRLMSIHKSKGLEFPVVIVAAMGKQFNNMDANHKTLIHPDLGLGIDYIDPNRRLRSQTLYKKIISRKIVLENLGEELRILYVALTRAKEKLILTGYVPSADKLLNNRSTSLMEREEKLSFHNLSNSKTYFDWVIGSLIRNKGFSQILADYDIDIPNDSPCMLEDVPFTVQIVNSEDIILSAASKSVEKHIERQLLTNWNGEVVYNKPIREAIEESLNWEYGYKNEIHTSIKVTVSELKRLGEDPELSVNLVDQKTDELGNDRLDNDEPSDSKRTNDKPVNRINEVGSNITLPRFRQEKSGLINTRYGTIIHKLFEKIPIDLMKDKATVLSEIERLTKEGYYTEEEANQINPYIFTSFYNTKLAKEMQIALQHNLLYRERPFVLGVPAKEILPQSASEELTMVQGVIDAYYESDGKLIIVDYKTDRASADQLIARYSIQLKYYKRALEQITGKQVEKTVIYSTYLKCEIEILV